MHPTRQELFAPERLFALPEQVVLGDAVVHVLVLGETVLLEEVLEEPDLLVVGAQDLGGHRLVLQEGRALGIAREGRIEVLPHPSAAPHLQGSRPCSRLCLFELSELLDELPLTPESRGMPIALRSASDRGSFNEAAFEDRRLVSTFGARSFGLFEATSFGVSGAICRILVLFFPAVLVDSGGFNVLTFGAIPLKSP